MDIQTYIDNTVDLLNQNFDVVIDMDSIPSDVGAIAHNLVQKRLFVRNKAVFVIWLKGKFKTGRESVVITGPMSNDTALQVGICVAECTSGPIAYYVKGSTKINDMIRDYKAEVEA